MCILVLLRRVVERYPLILLMNRDEAYERPSQPPLLSKNGNSVVAPEDRRAGGTWVGVNDMGLIAAISNRHAGEFDSTRRSRGLLCREALRQSSALEVKDLVEEELAQVDYNPFNLIYADAGRTFVTHHGEEIRTLELEGDVHILANLDVDDDDQARIRRAKEFLARLDLSEVGQAVEELQRLAADHEEVDGQSICLHRDSSGTVSSTIIAVSEEFPASSLFLYSPQSPCQSDYQDYSALLEEMMK